MDATSPSCHVIGRRRGGTDATPAVPAGGPDCDGMPPATRTAVRGEAATAALQADPIARQHERNTSDTVGIAVTGAPRNAVRVNRARGVAPEIGTEITEIRDHIGRAHTEIAGDLRS